MNKLLIPLFALTILYSPYSHSNILDDLLGKMSTNDVNLYDKTYTSGLYDGLGNAQPTLVQFRAKIKNLNQEKSIKEIYIFIETLDCKKGCKDCITADRGVYEVLKDTSPFSYLGKNDTILLPNTTFQVDIRIEDETAKSSYVQASRNETCYRSDISEVKGFHIFE